MFLLWIQSPWWFRSWPITITYLHTAFLLHPCCIACSCEYGGSPSGELDKASKSFFREKKSNNVCNKESTQSTVPEHNPFLKLFMYLRLANIVIYTLSKVCAITCLFVGLRFLVFHHQSTQMKSKKKKRVLRDCKQNEALLLLLLPISPSEVSASLAMAAISACSCSCRHQQLCVIFLIITTLNHSQ